METKICNTCGDEKSLSEYSYRDKRLGILNTRCKPCLSKASGMCNKKRREANPIFRECSNCGLEFISNSSHKIYCSDRCRDEFQIEAGRLRGWIYRKKHPDKVRVEKEIWMKSESGIAAMKKAREKWLSDPENKAHIKSNAKKWAKENKDKRNASSLKWKAKNKDHLIRYNKKRYQETKDNPDRAEYMKNYRHIYDKIYKQRPYVRIRTTMSCRIKEALKRQIAGKKVMTTIEYLGCTIPDLAKHLEAKFTDGMTFDNYGEWHTDHIIPCAAFDLTDPEQQRQCFHYTNLQPLWAEDNLSKGAKLPEDSQLKLVV